MAAIVQGHFDRFIENISLGEPQLTRIRRTAGTIADFLVQRYGLASPAVFLQGSFPNGTAVEPAGGGEYDVDLVCICVDDNTTAEAALDGLAATFRSDGRFAPRVVTKKPCVRLEYASDEVGSFHVDVVPVRYSQSIDAPLDAPRRGEGWHGTAPAQYTAWCQNQGPYFQRTVKAMKRWRDEQQTVRTAIKSIVLQVLVSRYMVHHAADADRLAATFRAMYDDLSVLSSPPVVQNPVVPSENLAARWTQSSFESFVRELKEAVDWSTIAVQATDTIEAAEAWRELLGDDFPETSPVSLGMRLGDFSHAQSPAFRGWRVALDPRYRVSVRATQQRGKLTKTQRPYPSDGPLIFAGHNLRFMADVVAPNHVTVWWQVANTGGHARSQSGLRGEYFRGRTLGRKPTNDQRETWETTSYTGSHLIRAVLVRDDAVVAESNWFQVNIYAKGRAFAL